MNKRKTRVGRVVSDKMQQTVVVVVQRFVEDPLYGRRLRRSTRLVAHDEEKVAHVGDMVRLEETRPLSRTKRWRVVELVSQGH